MTTTLKATKNGTTIIGTGENLCDAVFALQVSELQAGRHETEMWDEVTRFLESGLNIYHGLYTGWRLEKVNA